MKYCTRCLQPDTRPGIVFDEKGVCAACKNASARKNIDFASREEELAEIVEWAKSKKAPYDCVIGVSGGKDSTFQVAYAAELGLHPLLVNCVPDGISEVGRKNMENLLQFGFDTIHIRPNPVIEQYLMKQAFFKFGNFVKPAEYTLYASAYRTALEKGIPLVIQGENDADIFGVDCLPSGPDALNWADVDTVNGGDPSIFIDDVCKEKDLHLYKFPDKEEMKAAGMKAIFLEYYAMEWSVAKNTQFAIDYGLIGREDHDPAATGKINRFSSLDSELKVVNQMMKYLKFGFGQASDEVNNAIREGLMSRTQGIRILERYDGQCSEKYIFALCEYLEISLADFWGTVHRFVNNDLFYFNGVTRKYEPNFKVGK